MLVHSREIRKQIRTTKSSNLINLKKKFFRPTNNLILLNIENNDPFLTFPIDIFKTLTNLPNFITHVIISSLKITKKKKHLSHQIQQFY
jgi:hypothetical protein